MLSRRGLCDELITRPEESYRLWRVVVCDLETSKMRRLKPTTGLWKIQPKGCNAKKTNKQQTIAISTNKFVLMVNKFFSDICAFMGCYAARSGKSLPTFRDSLSVPSLGIK